MINYADYDFYTKEYKGSLSIDLFNSLIIKASREIDQNINTKLTNEVITKLDSQDQYKLKFVACELCDYFNANGTSASSGASSISIDGVSINRGTDSIQAKSINKRHILNGLPDELIRFL